jgi:hypothetical protein
LARVSPWLFVDISKIPDKEPYVQPTHHYTKWTVLELQSWLASRGLPKAGLKQELLDKVDILMKHDEGPPQVNQMVVSPEEIMLLVVRLNQMITLLMCEEFSDKHVQHGHTLPSNYSWIQCTKWTSSCGMGLVSRSGTPWATT